jgi:hypothetical protein
MLFNRFSLTLSLAFSLLEPKTYHISHKKNRATISTSETHPV